MAQFDVYKNKSQNAKSYPYLLDVQHVLHERTSTRVVIPLATDVQSVRRLMPEFEVEGMQVVMSTMEMAGVPLDILGVKVANLEEERSQIIDAIDFVINGF